MPDAMSICSVKPAGEVVLTDSNMLGLVQRSSRLTYACLLIEMKRFEQAENLISVDLDNENPRLHELAQYLRLYCWIESRRIEDAKMALLQLLEDNPQDHIALSLLEAALIRELEEQPPNSEVQEPNPVTLLKMEESPRENEGPKPVQVSDVESMFQAIVEDPDTHLVMAWQDEGEPYLATKHVEFETRAREIPSVFPGELPGICTGLDIGRVNKVTFSFDKEVWGLWHEKGTHFAVCSTASPRAALTFARAERIFKESVGNEANHLLQEEKDG